MSKTTTKASFRYRVAYLHRLRKGLGQISAIGIKAPLPEGITEEGQKLGLSDWLAEEVLFLTGETTDEDIMSQGNGSAAAKEWPIDCNEHGRQPCYCTCIHVAHQGAKVHFVEKATITNIGQLCCESCASGDVPLSEDMATIVCAECALLAGWLSGGIQ